MATQRNTSVKIRKIQNFIDGVLVRELWDFTIYDCDTEFNSNFTLSTLADLKLLKEKIDEAILKEEVK